MTNSLPLLILLLPSLAAFANAAELKPETLHAWDEYLHTANSRMKDRLRAGTPFLWMDESPSRMTQVRSGEIVIAPLGDSAPTKVPSGLIHHWIGAAFIPNVTLGETIAVVRDYARYTDIYPAVISAKPLDRAAMEDKFSVRMMNNLLVQKKALQTENESSFFKVTDKKWYSFCKTTRVQEIDNYGQPNEEMLADGQGTGYIWRLDSITRFEERDGGVYVELEAFALTRDIPASLRWVAAPVVRRVSRNSIYASLHRTQQGIESISAGRHERRETIADGQPALPAAIRTFRQP